MACLALQEGKELAEPRHFDHQGIIDQIISEGGFALQAVMRTELPRFQIRRDDAPRTQSDAPPSPAGLQQDLIVAEVTLGQLAKADRGIFFLPTIPIHHLVKITVELEQRLVTMRIAVQLSRQSRERAGGAHGKQGVVKDALSLVAVPISIAVQYCEARPLEVGGLPSPVIQNSQANSLLPELPPR